MSNKCKLKLICSFWLGLSVELDLPKSVFSIFCGMQNRTKEYKISLKLKKVYSITRHLKAPSISANIWHLKYKLKEAKYVLKYLFKRFNGVHMDVCCLIKTTKNINVTIWSWLALLLLLLKLISSQNFQELVKSFVMEHRWVTI